MTKSSWEFIIDDFKVEVVKINLSTPILMKSRCRSCGKHPDVYYYIQQALLNSTPRAEIKQFDWVKRRLRRMSADWYLTSSPKSYSGVSSFSHPVTYKGFNPRLLRSGSAQSGNYIEYLTCECIGAPNWTWMDKGNQTPEHRHRRARITYPKSFLY